MLDCEIHEGAQTLKAPEIAMVAQPDLPRWRIFGQHEPSDIVDLIADRARQDRDAQALAAHLCLEVAIVRSQSDAGTREALLRQSISGNVPVDVSMTISRFPIPSPSVGSLIKADTNRQKGVEGADGLPPESVSRAARQYLAVLDDAAFGAATPVTPKFISPADPAARWTGADGGLAFFAYEVNYLIHMDHAIIVDVEPTTAIRQAEVTAAKRMIERCRERFDLYPARLAGDSGYGLAAMLGWLVDEQGIEPHIPVFDKSARKDVTFSRDAFAYDIAGDVFDARPAIRS